MLLSGCGFIQEAYEVSDNYESEYKKRFKDYDDNDERVEFFSAIAKSTLLQISITQDKNVKIHKIRDYERVRKIYPEIYKYLVENEKKEQKIIDLVECKFFDSQNWNCAEETQENAYSMLKGELLVYGIKYKKTYKLTF